MTILELKNQIMHNELSNLYIFVGEEIGIMNIYLDEMSNTLSLPKVRAESIASIYSDCTVRSIFGDDNKLYIIRNDTDIQKHEDVYTTLKQDIGGNVIVLLYDKIDSRLKFGKYFKDDTVIFEPLSTSVLCNYIKKVCPLNDKNLEKLSNIVCNSYDLSMLEADKINRYAKVNNISVDRSFEELLNEGAIYVPRENNIFDFVDAVMSRQVSRSFYLLQGLLDDSTSAINILGVLYTKVKNVLLIQVCEDKDISNTTGLDNREIYFNKKYLNKYSDGTLVYALKLIAKTIEDVKEGSIDDCYATQLVLVKIL